MVSQWGLVSFKEKVLLFGVEQSQSTLSAEHLFFHICPIQLSVLLLMFCAFHFLSILGTPWSGQHGTHLCFISSVRHALFLVTLCCIFFSFAVFVVVAGIFKGRNRRLRDLSCLNPGFWDQHGQHRETLSQKNKIKRRGPGFYCAGNNGHSAAAPFRDPTPWDMHDAACAIKTLSCCPWSAFVQVKKCLFRL